MDLVGSIGSGTSAGYITVQTNTQWDASQTPNNIVFDRCMFVGNPLSAVRQGVRIAGRNVTVENSYFDQIRIRAIRKASHAFNAGACHHHE